MRPTGREVAIPPQPSGIGRLFEGFQGMVRKKESRVKPIRFSQYALIKLDVLAAHGWKLTKKQIEAIISKPDRIEEGYKGRQTAQKRLGANHVLRVVFEEEMGDIVVVTVYPGRRERYDKD